MLWDVVFKFTPFLSEVFIPMLFTCGVVVYLQSVLWQASPQNGFFFVFFDFLVFGVGKVAWSQPCWCSFRTVLRRFAGVGRVSHSNKRRPAFLMPQTLRRLCFHMKSQADSLGY